MSVISASRRLMQDDHEFEASLGYKMRPCVKKRMDKKKIKRERKK
jgi:hypothetical protein